MDIEIVNISNQRTELIVQLLQLWETSVCSSHHFLPEEHIVSLRPLVSAGLQEIRQLVVAMDSDIIAGFAGIDGDKMEMLFLAPEYFGQGIGRQLLNASQIKYVDVNEQNPDALRFYEKCGFVIYDRSELDGQGNPFPILHLTKKIIETERLILREMMQTDFSSVAVMLQDEEVMAAWEHAFSDDEVRQWIERNMARYQNDGYGYYLAFDKQSNQCIGQIGLLSEEIFGVKHLGVGWIVAKKYWFQGFAVEGAKGCIAYAFETLNAPRVIADIRPQNIASIAVAERLGMIKHGEYDKMYNGKIMPHVVYVLRTNQIQVLNYQEIWPKNFTLLVDLLSPILQEFGGRVEHVGSTSVPNLAAKPIIDADYILPENADFPEIIKALEKIGFYHLGDGGLPVREMFSESLYLPFRHNFYVCQSGGVHLENHLQLRDYLRKNPDDAARYGKLKSELAAQYPNDIDNYCAGKSDLLSVILTKAGFKLSDVQEINNLNKSCNITIRKSSQL